MNDLAINGCGDLVLTLVLAMNVFLSMEAVVDVLVSSLVDIGVADLLGGFGTSRSISCNLLDMDWTTKVERHLKREKVSAVESSCPRSRLAHLFVQRSKRTRERLHLMLTGTGLAIHIGDLPIRSRRTDIGVLNCLDRLAKPITVQLLLRAHGTEICNGIASKQHGCDRDNGSEGLHDGQQVLKSCMVSIFLWLLSLVVLDRPVCDLYVHKRERIRGRVSRGFEV